MTRFLRHVTLLTTESLLVNVPFLQSGGMVLRLEACCCTGRIHVATAIVWQSFTGSLAFKLCDVSFVDGMYTAETCYAKVPAMSLPREASFLLASGLFRRCQ